MRLTSLEIKGFKSFAEKTVINFNQDITGIVGPNGCGKSNIVDAIRWVLGEQKTKALRSEKMENLIFNGTKQRRASGIAEVSLTFDNTRNVLPTDYSSVRVSRIYHRNGESEYRLNDVPCRLKDILNLFMDTGIGSDSYAIIELKMIDDILSDKDGARRKLFEQAAGIEKYKVRKRETFNKLKATQQDLERVEDLLHEVAGQMKQLEAQARRANRFRKLKDDYREHSLDMARLEISDFAKRKQALVQREAEAKDKLAAIQSELATAEAELEKIQSNHLTREKALQESQRVLNVQIGEVQRLESQKKLIIQKQGFLGDRNSDLQRGIDEAHARQQELQTNITALLQEIANCETSEQQAIAELTQAESRHKELGESHEAARAAYHQAQEANRLAKEELSHIEKERAVLLTRLEALASDAAKSKGQASKLEAELSSFREQLEVESKKREEHRKALDKILKRKQHVEAGIEAKNKVVESLREKHDTESRLLDARRNEQQLLQDLVNNLEGFPESLRFLKREVEWTKQAPLVSDIIAVPDEYRVTVESYLEPWLNYYVVSNVREALDCVETLNSASKGRAGFFLLDQVESYQSEQPFVEPGLTPVLDVLEVEKRYSKLAAYLLDSVFLISEKDLIENSQQLVQKTRQTNGRTPTFLTPNGKVLRSGFTLSGGSVGLFQGKRLGRSKQLDKLNADIRKLEKTCHALAEQLEEQQRQLAAMKSELVGLQPEAIRSDLHSAEQHIASLEARIRHHEESLDAMAQSHTERANSTTENQRLETELNQRFAQGQANVMALTEAHNQASTLFNEAEAQLRQSADDLNQCRIANNQAVNARQQANRELSFARQRLEELRTKEQDDRKALEVNLQQLHEHDDSFGTLETDLKQAYDQRSQLEKALAAEEEAYYAQRSEMTDRNQALRKKQTHRLEVDQLIAEIREELNQLQLANVGLTERLSVEFKCSLQDVLDREAIEDVQIDELSEKIEVLRGKIERFGEVNPFAEEAYTEIEKRHTFITEQKADLEGARQNLMDTIAEIDQTATTCFTETFEKVREYFKKVFRNLFSDEDQCDLILADPENPLESAIEIIARPKGKRPLTINQLSGGEKSLTAIAMLFALYLIKPAPFCIFDEVDAPLDDANVTKFSNIIRNFADESQFIVVTHNKQTMTSVDVIYGVTMMEEGISRVVPVDFGNLN